MITKIKKYLYLINSVKLEFNNPLHKEIVIFDNTSIDDLKYILSKRKYFTLGARFDGISKIYISLRILYFFFKDYNHNIFSSYLIALIITNSSNMKPHNNFNLNNLNIAIIVNYNYAY